MLELLSTELLNMKIGLIIIVLFHLDHIVAVESYAPVALKGMVRRQIWPYVQWNNHAYEGLYIDVLKLVTQKIGLNYTLYLIADHRWRPKMNYQKYDNRMINELKSGNADFAIGDITVNPDQRKDIEFTEPILENIKVAGIIRRNEAKGICNLVDIVRDNNQHSVSYGTIEDEYVFNWMRSIPKRSLLYRLFLMMNRNNVQMVEDDWEGLDKVKRLRYAYIVDSLYAELEAGKNCTFTVMTDDSQKTRSYAIALPKGSPHLSAFNAAIQELKANKSIDKLRKKYWPNNCGHNLYVDCPKV